MRKVFLKSMLLLCALIVGSGSVWGTEVLSYTLTPASGSNNSYGSNCDITISGITWNLAGNSQVQPWRLGGAKTATLDGVNRVLYSKTAISDNITKISITQGTDAYITVNSMTVSVHSSAADAESGSNAIATFSPEYAASSTINISKADATSWAGKFYRIVYNLTKTNTKNAGYVSISEAKFYTEVTLIDPTITFNDGSVRVGKTLDLSTLFDSNSAGAVTYSITAGDSYATIDGSTLTGVAVGDVTVQASQVAAGTYNAKTATATISVVDPALSSIAITTAPTKTTYDEGELFDATDMVVTATFANSETEDVSASCTWAPNGALTTSDTEVTVSYSYKGVTKTATQDITVNAYEQPLSVTIDMDYNWLGSTNGGNLDQAVLPVVKSDDHVTTTITDGTSTRPRGDGNYIRVYKGSTITFAAPTGYCITSLEFTTGGNGTWNAPTVSNGSLSDTEWTGKAPSVTLYLSGSCFIASVAVTLEVATAINIDITAANWASFSSAYEVSIPSGVTAYYAQIKDEETVTLKEITGGYIPANTGVVVYAAEAETYTATITTTGATLGESNLLKPWLTAGTPGDATYYTLAAGPQFKKSSGGILAAGKAYLVMSSGSGAPSIIRIEDEVNNATNVANIEANEKVVKFITNGQLFIRRGDITYDALGRVVR